MVFAYRGSALSHDWKRIAGATVVSLLVTLLAEQAPEICPSLTPLPFQILSVVLGIFLGFLNNASYDRFWEGRKLWGSLVNTSRNWHLQITTFVRAPEQSESACAPQNPVNTIRNRLVKRQIAFVHALKCQLRGNSPHGELAGRLPDDELKTLESHNNVALAINAETGRQLRELWSSGWITDYHLTQLDANLSTSIDILGACDEDQINADPVPVYNPATSGGRFLMFFLAPGDRAVRGPHDSHGDFSRVHRIFWSR